ncbi:carbamate kinase [Endozoicomonas sp. Mp262]|uniref:amino acid kinase family protein n=1 Tax=Endozoicomonas sp. Mp262 TaxID=2919499 RepID=UPI0021D8D966
MRVVISLGDSAFLQKSQPLKVHLLQKSIQLAASAVAKIAGIHQSIILHNNGPQIGMLTLMHSSSEELSLSSADVIGAQSRGVIGLWLEQELRNSLPDNTVCSLINLTAIDANDPALMEPTLYCGPVYTRVQAQLVQEQNPGWKLVKDGQYYRRLIATPEPKEIMELPVLKQLIASDRTTVICGSGGGLPVCRSDSGQIHGIEAAINQDQSAALIAEGIEADALLLLSATEALAEPVETAQPRLIKAVTPEKLVAAGFTHPGIKARIRAARYFISSTADTGRLCAMGSLFNAMDVLSGTSGTRVANDVQDSITYY